MSRSQVAKSFLAVLGTRSVEVLLSLAVSILLAHRLGAGVETDAFLLVRRLSSSLTEALRRIVLTIYIPPLVARLRHAGGAEIWRPWARGTLRIVLPAVLLSGLAAALAPELVALLAPGFDPARADLAARMLRLLVWLMPVGILVATLASLSYASRHFALPEAARPLPRVLVVAALLVAVPPASVVVLGWAILIGTLLGLALQILSARRALRAPAGVAPANPEGVGQALDLKRRVLPALLMFGYFQSSVWLDFAFASTLGIGAVSVLDYGQRLINLVPGVLTMSIITVAYPDLARRAGHEGAGLRAGIVQSIRAGLFVQLPLILFLMLAANDVVAIILQHGVFSGEAAAASAAVMRFFAPAVLLSFIANMVLTGLYADPEVPHLKMAALAAAAATAVRVVALVVLAPALDTVGIAVAGGLSAGTLLLMLLITARRRWGPLLVAGDRPALLKMALALALAGVVMLGALDLTGCTTLPWCGLPRLVMVALSALAGGATYFGAAALLGVAEARLLGRLMPWYRR